MECSLYATIDQDKKQYQVVSTKFKKACSQVISLNNQIIDCQTRYDRAVSNQQRSYRYVLRLRLMSIEGVRNCIYEYARIKGQEIEDLQDKLIAAGVMEPEYEVTDEEEMDIV